MRSRRRSSELPHRMRRRPRHARSRRSSRRTSRPARRPSRRRTLHNTRGLACTRPRRRPREAQCPRGPQACRRRTIRGRRMSVLRVRARTHSRARARTVPAACGRASRWSLAYPRAPRVVPEAARRSQSGPFGRVSAYVGSAERSAITASSSACVTRTSRWSPGSVSCHVYSPGMTSIRTPTVPSGAEGSDPSSIRGSSILRRPCARNVFRFHLANCARSVDPILPLAPTCRESRLCARFRVAPGVLLPGRGLS